MRLLGDKFLCGWKNIEKAEFAGRSTRHFTEAPAMNVNTCSGHKNVQMFFLTADGRVLHCLPGYWQPEYFLAEAKLALELDAIYRDEKLSKADKNDRFMMKHLARIKSSDKKLRYGSQLQGFDVHIEKRKKSDFTRTEGPLKGGMKTVDQVMHERMAALPFVRFDRFDIPKYVDFGQKHYAYHLGKHDKQSKKHKVDLSN